MKGTTVRKARQDKAGFSVVEALIIIIVIGVLGFMGWTVYHARNNTHTTVTSSTTPSADTTPLTQEYVDTNGNFSIKYPKSWKLAVGDTIRTPGSEKSNATLTSPTGTILTLKTDWGGKGGYCPPAGTDKPFQAGNACASEEILSSEPLSSVTNVYYPVQDNTSTASPYKQSTIVLTTTHYADPSGASTYIIGLKNSDPPYQVQVNTSNMGLVAPENYITVYDASGKFFPYVYAYATSPSPSFLNSTDTATVKSILKTLALTH